MRKPMQNIKMDMDKGQWTVATETKENLNIHKSRKLIIWTLNSKRNGTLEAFTVGAGSYGHRLENTYIYDEVYV